MPNGKIHDNPLSDLTIHGLHSFPSDIEEMLLRIDSLGRKPGRWPLGENLKEARRELAHFIAMLEASRGDEVMVDPRTQRPFVTRSG
jgi:hypothetical protein